MIIGNIINTVSLSRLSLVAIKTLGNLIKIARKERKISQNNLGLRLNVSRYTIIAIEKGDPKVAIGIFFEAARIVGVPLIVDDEKNLFKFAKSITQFNSILPQRVRKKNEPVDDQF